MILQIIGYKLHMLHVAGTLIKIYLQNVSNVGQYFMHAAYMGPGNYSLMKFELKLRKSVCPTVYVTSDVYQ